MFKRILIANRGEIACRIIETCRRLGVETVAVHSEADRSARHVRMADLAVEIGPAEASKSYLVVDRILDAARDNGDEAIHPGYGFLSENAGFARAVEESGLVLVGPSADTIEAMGSKARAKAIMEEAGVPLVPGYHGDAQDDETLVSEANDVGFPLMLKAAAGGGGKGMRVARDEESFEKAFSMARQEAGAAFDDPSVYLEKFIDRPRHVEIQVLGDHHGNLVHLGERDCSVQRRHQKLIEESPSPILSEEIRREMGQAAVRGSEAIGYRNAGTMEFLVTPQEEFYFMEMNTRIQVEHPVTEMVTGVDLVKQQVRVASGERMESAVDDLPEELGPPSEYVRHSRDLIFEWLEFLLLHAGYQGATDTRAVVEVTRPSGQTFRRIVMHRFPERSQDFVPAPDDPTAPVNRRLSVVLLRASKSDSSASSSRSASTPTASPGPGPSGPGSCHPQSPTSSHAAPPESTPVGPLSATLGGRRPHRADPGDVHRARRRHHRHAADPGHLRGLRRLQPARRPVVRRRYPHRLQHPAVRPGDRRLGSVPGVGR